MKLARNERRNDVGPLWNNIRKGAIAESPFRQVVKHFKWQEDEIYTDKELDRITTVA